MKKFWFIFMLMFVLCSCTQMKEDTSSVQSELIPQLSVPLPKPLKQDPTASVFVSPDSTSTRKLLTFEQALYADNNNTMAVLTQLREYEKKPQSIDPVLNNYFISSINIATGQEKNTLQYSSINNELSIQMLSNYTVIFDKNKSIATIYDNYLNPLFVQDIVFSKQNQLYNDVYFSDDLKLYVNFNDYRVGVYNTETNECIWPTPATPEPLQFLDHTKILANRYIIGSIENMNMKLFPEKNYTMYVVDIFNDCPVMEIAHCSGFDGPYRAANNCIIWNPNIGFTNRENGNYADCYKISIDENGDIQTKYYTAPQGFENAEIITQNNAKYILYVDMQKNIQEGVFKQPIHFCILDLEEGTSRTFLTQLPFVDSVIYSYAVAPSGEQITMFANITGSDPCLKIYAINTYTGECTFLHEI